MATTYLRGVNSFGADAGSAFPGTYDVDYHYDGLASHQYYASRGHQVIRLPFKWERIQPTRGAALDPTELGRLTTAVGNIHSAGMRAILDVHNYCRRVEGGSTLVMGTDFPVSDLVDLWTRLSTAFRGDTRIYAYGLMNEPHDLAGAPATLTTANATLYNFDSGSGGWKSDTGATVTNGSSPTHDGTGSLSLTQASGNYIRADDNGGQSGLTDANGTYLGVWVYIPAGQPSGWTAHVELYDASYSPVAGPDAPLAVGAWTQIAAGFSTTLWANHKNIAVQINPPSALTSSVTVTIDTVQQGTGTPGQTGAQVWENASQQLVAAIRNNGDGTLLLIPGYGYSEAAYWYANHPDGGWITDSANNYLYEAHYYFDFSSQNSSTYPDTYAQEDAAAQAAGYTGLLDRARQGLLVWLTWLTNASAPGGFLSEIGWPGGDGSYTADAASWNAVGDALYTLLDAYGIGATYWAGGEFWGYETYNLQLYSIASGVSATVGPVSLALAQATVVEAHLPAPAALIPYAFSGGVVSFADALTAAAAEWRVGVDLLASDEATALEAGGLYDLMAADRMLPGSATVTLDTTQSTLRTLSLALRTSDGRYLPGASGYPSGGAGSPTASGLTWFDVRYRPWLDLATGFNADGSRRWTRTTLGIFVLTQPQVQVQAPGAVAQLTLADKSALLQKPYRLTAANLPTYTASGGHTAGGYAAGTAVDTAMNDLAQRAGIPAARIHFEPTTTTLPGDYAVAEGDEPWTHLRTLAGTLGHVLYFDRDGNLVRRANPLSVNTPPVWTFTPGPLCTVAALTRSTDFSNTFNHIIVCGGSSATALVRGEAMVTDASSPYHANALGDRVTFWGQNGLGDMTPDPTIGSVAAAQAQAQLLLAQHLGQQETIQLQGRTLPTLAPYDRITVDVPQAGLATDAQLTQLTIPLATNGAMTLTAARWLQVGS